MSKVQTRRAKQIIPKFFNDDPSTYDKNTFKKGLIMYMIENNLDPDFKEPLMDTYRGVLRHLATINPKWSVVTEENIKTNKYKAHSTFMNTVRNYHNSKETLAKDLKEERDNLLGQEEYEESESDGHKYSRDSQINNREAKSVISEKSPSPKKNDMRDSEDVKKEDHFESISLGKRAHWNDKLEKIICEPHSQIEEPSLKVKRLHENLILMKKEYMEVESEWRRERDNLRWIKTPADPEKLFHSTSAFKSMIIKKSANSEDTDSTLSSRIEITLLVKLDVKDTLILMLDLKSVVQRF